MPARRTDITPHAFAGTALIDGVAAPDGTPITAWVEGLPETVGEGVVSGGIYNLKVFQFGSSSFGGKTITFQIGALTATQTAIWQSFGADELNLTATN